MPFEIEKSAYKVHLEELRPFTGQWVLIYKTELVGTYVTLDQVLEVAYARFSPGTFYITQIETPVYLDFDLSPEDAGVHDKAA